MSAFRPYYIYLLYLVEIVSVHFQAQSSLEYRKDIKTVTQEGEQKLHELSLEV